MVRLKSALPATHTHSSPAAHVSMLVSMPAGPNWRLKLLAATERQTFKERRGQTVTTEKMNRNSKREIERKKLLDRRKQIERSLSNRGTQ